MGEPIWLGVFLTFFNRSHKLHLMRAVAMQAAAPQSQEGWQLPTDKPVSLL